MTATDRRTHDLPKAYTPADFEAAIYQRWLDADVFAPDGNGSTADPGQPPFVIIQPPPNITGSLHLGHAQRSAVEDLMVRRARMLGRAASRASERSSDGHKDHQGGDHGRLRHDGPRQDEDASSLFLAGAPE